MSVNDSVRVLQVLPSMGHGGIEHFLMNLYRTIDKDRIQFDFMYRVPYECVFDKEIESLGGRIFRCIDPDRHPISSNRYYRHFFADHPEIKVVHEHRSGCDGCLGVMREAKRAGIVTRIFHSHSSKKGWAKNPVKDATDAFNAPRLDKIANTFIACSDVAADYLFNRCPSARSACVVAPNAINLQSFLFNNAARKAVRQQFGISSNAFVVGHVGRFVEEKNQAFLVEVLASLRSRGVPAELLLLGDGPTLQDVVAKADAIGIAGYVHFAGLQNNVVPFYSAMDLFCMPSLFEGLPVSCVEAQANGLPMVLSTGVTHQADICGHTAFLNLIDGPDAWAELIMNSTACGRFENTSSLIAAGYDIEDATRHYEQLYMTGEW